MQLGEAASDALTGTGTTALPDETFNYIRNSVKATVDAYDGTVTLYAWDEEDPVLQTYMKAFPGVVQPRSEMSEELISHVRYPEDLFKVQREILTRYHVDDPGRLLQRQRPLADPERPDPRHRRGPAAVLHPRPAADRRRSQLPADQRAQRVRTGQPVGVHLGLERTRRPTATSRCCDCPGNDPLPRADPGAAVVQHERRGRPRSVAVPERQLATGLRQPADAADR